MQLEITEVEPLFTENEYISIDDFKECMKRFGVPYRFVDVIHESVSPVRPRRWVNADDTIVFEFDTLEPSPNFFEFAHAIHNLAPAEFDMHEHFVRLYWW